MPILPSERRCVSTYNICFAFCATIYLLVYFSLTASSGKSKTVLLDTAKIKPARGYWLGSDCDGIEDVARIEGEYLPCCIEDLIPCGRTARSSVGKKS